MKKDKLYEVRKISTIKEMLEQSCEIFATSNAFLRKVKKGEGYSPITYAQFKEDVWAFGTALYNIGLKGGKRIAVIGENRYEYAMAYMAAVNGDTMFVPIDRELAAPDIINLLKIAKVSAVVYSPKIASKLESAKAEVSTIEYMISMDANDEKAEKTVASLIDEGKKLIKGGDKSFDEITIDPNEAKIILFTSGTTALSKGVLLCHRNICANLMAMCSMVDIRPDDVFLSVLPPHHTYESTCGTLAPLYRGSCVAYADGLLHIAKNLGEAKATVLLGVPQLFELFYKRIWASAKDKGIEGKLKKGLMISNFLRKIGIDKRRSIFSTIHENFGGKLRLFISGAAAINPSVAKGFRDLGILFLQGYGITECSPIVTLNRDINFKDHAAGLPLNCLEVKIDNPNEEGIGEIICKGDNVMLGYYENDEETAKVLKDGWFYTGDLGYMDKDGFVIISGRKKNVIIDKNGKNVYPEELETFLTESPYVLECMVYAHEDENTFEIRAQIFPNLPEIEANFGKDVSDEKIQEIIDGVVKEVNGRNPTWKYIRKAVVRKEEFTKTTTKKIKRYAEENQEK